MKAFVESRKLLSIALSMTAGIVAIQHAPFPEENNLLQLFALHRPAIFQVIKAAYTAMLFTTPFITFSVLFSLAYIYLLRDRDPAGLVKLPPYPNPSTRDKLFVVMPSVPT